MFQNQNCGNVLDHENKKHNSTADDRQQIHTKNSLFCY